MDKLREPDARNEMLGVELDMSASMEGVVSVCNKQDKVEEIKAMLGNAG